MPGPRLFILPGGEPKPDEAAVNAIDRDDGAVEVKGGHVALNVGLTHAAAQVRVKRGRQDLNGEP